MPWRKTPGRPSGAGKEKEAPGNEGGRSQGPTSPPQNRANFARQHAIALVIVARAAAQARRRRDADAILVPIQSREGKRIGPAAVHCSAGAMRWAASAVQAAK